MTPKPSLAKLQKQVDTFNAEHPVARAAIEDVVIEFGLTDRATKVWSDDPRDETICTRLDRAGHALAPEDVSKACASLHRQGRIEKRPHGYRMRAESVA